MHSCMYFLRYTRSLSLKKASYLISNIIGNHHIVSHGKIILLSSRKSKKKACIGSKYQNLVINQALMYNSTNWLFLFLCHSLLPIYSSVSFIFIYLVSKSIIFLSSTRCQRTSSLFSCKQRTWLDTRLYRSSTHLSYTLMKSLEDENLRFYPHKKS